MCSTRHTLAETRRTPPGGGFLLWKGYVCISPPSVYCTELKSDAAYKDHLTLLRVYTEYRSVNGSAEWCRKNFVNSRTLKTVVDTRGQLRGMCTRLALPMSSCQGDTAVIRKALIGGLFRNVATLQHSGLYRVSSTGQQGQIHPSSALFRATPPVILYSELVRTSKLYVSAAVYWLLLTTDWERSFSRYFRQCTTVEQQWVDEMDPKAARRGEAT